MCEKSNMQKNQCARGVVHEVAMCEKNNAQEELRAKRQHVKQQCVKRTIATRKELQ
jgi:hypothetical protein